MPTLYSNLKIEKLADNEAEISGEIPFEVITRYSQTALDNLKKEFELPGFRRGQVPKEMILKNINELHFWEDAAEESLIDIYDEIIRHENLKTLSRPHISITKIAIGNPVNFKIKVGLWPEIKLPNYKKISREINSKKAEIDVGDEEMDDTIKEILKLRTTGGQFPAAASTGSNKPAEPELTDEYVKTLGRFENVADFKNKIKENIQLDKERGEKNKRREEIVSKLLEAAKIVIPPIALEDEIAQTRQDRNDEIERMGINLEDYLKSIHKTEEELASEESAYVARVLKTKIILSRIAQEEDIRAAEDEIETETQTLLKHYPGADPVRTKSYVENIITNEKILRFLEGGEKQ